MPLSTWWPIGLVVLSNIIYHISSKQTPAAIHPLASLSVTYLVGAAVSALLYAALSRGGHLLAEYRQLNWTALALGLAIVGLEAGNLYMYKLGWNVNSGHLTHSALLSIALLFVGRALYGEPITANKLIGIVLCLAGLTFISR